MLNSLLYNQRKFLMRNYTHDNYIRVRNYSKSTKECDC